MKPSINIRKLPDIRGRGNFEARLLARLLTRILMGVFAVGTAAGAQAHSVSQRIGVYVDNEGLERRQVGLDIDVAAGGFAPGMNSSSYVLSLSREHYVKADVEDDDYMSEVYGSGFRTTNAGVLSARQTWNTVYETRLMGAWATDTRVKRRSFGGGASRWLAHETLRISLDVSSTLVDRPVFEILDYDSQTLSPPSQVSSRGAILGVRHLARPTTIADYGYSEIIADDRPRTRVFLFGLRQFFPPLDAAVHLDASRAINRGEIGLGTTYGQVDAWILETAWAQELWRGGRGRFSYRFYREDETTRAYRDEKVFGSDTFTLGMVQDIPKGAVEGIGVPLTVKSLARYLTNTDSPPCLRGR